jgi:8-oxo-dGTP pyrophosphatase MutT (NUDIX family)
VPGDLFDVYPELRAPIGALCPGRCWALTGVSALVYDDAAYYLELTKPKHWHRRPDGATVVGIGGIGGSLEPGESVLECLARELQEELGCAARLASARSCHLVYEESRLVLLVPPRRAYPVPLLFTVSANLYRRDELAADVLAIATFWARLAAPPVLGDLYGLLRVPFAALPDLMEADEWRAADLLCPAADPAAAVTATTRTPLPADAVLRPVWTAHSLQLLLQAHGPVMPPATPA